MFFLDISLRIRCSDGRLLCSNESNDSVALLTEDQANSKDTNGLYIWNIGWECSPEIAVPNEGMKFLDDELDSVDHQLGLLQLPQQQQQQQQQQEASLRDLEMGGVEESKLQSSLGDGREMVIMKDDDTIASMGSESTNSNSKKKRRPAPNVPPSSSSSSLSIPPSSSSTNNSLSSDPLGGNESTSQSQFSPTHFEEEEYPYDDEESENEVIGEREIVPEEDEDEDESFIGDKDEEINTPWSTGHEDNESEDVNESDYDEF